MLDAAIEYSSGKRCARRCAYVTLIPKYLTTKLKKEAEQIPLSVHTVLNEEHLIQGEEEHGDMFQREVCVHLDQREEEQDQQLTSAAVASSPSSVSAPS